MGLKEDEMKRLKEDSDSEDDKDGGHGSFNPISSYVGSGAG
jgi:hypothetical protein